MVRRLALITGGTSGIGLGIAQKLAPDFDLALAYASNHERAKVVASELGAKVFCQPLSTYADAQSLVEKVKAECGKAPDVLVNSAGKIRDGLFMGSDFAQTQELIQEHLVMTMAMSHCVIKDMYRSKWGRIINLSSISAQFSKRGQCNYCAAKAGIEGFTRTLALEVAHRGITVNAVAPGLIETPMTEGVIKMFSEKEDLSAKIPVGKVGKPADIGSYVKYLCSDDAYYVTGTVLTIDGGRSTGDTRS